MATTGYTLKRTLREYANELGRTARAMSSRDMRQDAMRAAAEEIRLVLRREDVSVRDALELVARQEHFARQAREKSTAYLHEATRAMTSAHADVYEAVLARLVEIAKQYS